MTNPKRPGSCRSLGFNYNRPQGRIESTMKATSNEPMCTSTTHPITKVANAQRDILKADTCLQEIRRLRNELLKEEFDRAKAQLKAAEKKAFREAALAVLQSIKFDLSVGKPVRGIAKERSYMLIGSGSGIQTEPECRFTVTNVHIGRKHLGVHVDYDKGKKSQWVEACRLNGDHHCLDSGLEYQSPVVRPDKLREQD